mgnify:CR=1 FL=1
MRLPVLSGEEVAKILMRIGFKPVRRRGSHLALVKERRIVIVPLHREIKKGTLLAIIKQAGLTREEFLKLVKEHL